MRCGRRTWWLAGGRTVSQSAAENYSTNLSLLPRANYTIHLLPILRRLYYIPRQTFLRFLRVCFVAAEMKLSKFSGPASDSPPFLHDKSYAAADKLRVPNVFFLSPFSFFFLHPSVEISKIRKGIDVFVNGRQAFVVARLKIEERNLEERVSSSGARLSNIPSRSSKIIEDFEESFPRNYLRKRPSRRASPCLCTEHDLCHCLVYFIYFLDLSRQMAYRPVPQ